MTTKKGDYLGGIRTLEDLRIRCRMDEETGCWVWIMGTGGRDVPCVSIQKNGKPVSVRGRRAALELAGPVPTKKVVASNRLTCTNSMCVNPEHSQWLTIGTFRSRLAERPITFEKLRQNGIQNRHRLAKLTEAQVLEIRQSSEPVKVLCKRYGVSKGTICNIRNHHTWRDLGALKGSSIFSLAAYA